MSASRPVTPGGVDQPDALGNRLDDTQPPADRADRAVGRSAHAALPSLAQRRALLAAAVTVAGFFLFFCYLRLSRTLPVDSDGAGNALQAWDMLHGNLLLRGWTLSDVSFYTTELPEYMLIELIHGLNSQVEHIAGALTYTLLVVTVALVAKGQATGRQAALRMLVAAGIMIAPQLAGIQVLMGQPDHTGTNVPVLLAWLVVDRGGRRWWVPPAAAVLLAVAYVADPAALVVGIAPLLVVVGWRLFQRVYQRRPADTKFWPELARARYELALVGAALVALAAGLVVPKIISHIGGYSLLPAPSTIAQSSDMISHIWSTVDGVLLLFGANFLGLNLSFATGLVALHLVGVVLAVWAVCAGVRRFAGDDLVSSMLAVGALLALVAFLLYPKFAEPREMVAVLPFAAALAGRLFAKRLAAARLEPVMAVVLCLYVVSLYINVTSTPEATDYRPLASWLSDHGLRYGLANYDFANSVTLASGNRVQIRPVAARGTQQLYPRLWEADKSWYNPSLHYANFVVSGPLPGAVGTVLPSLSSVRRTFGPPARHYKVDGVTVLVWDYNLLTRTGWGQPWPVFNPSIP